VTTYDVIVLGAGGVGSAAFFELARRGARVLAIDQFEPPHDRGSSHGQTRIIRQAYFEHPDYVPLLRRAYQHWAELEWAAGQRLYHETGLLEVGPADGVVVPGVLRAARLHGLEVDHFTPREARRRFPQFCVPGDTEAVFESRAGYLLVERCVDAYLSQGQRLGGKLRPGERVVDWRVEPTAITVQTEAGAYWAARLVVAAGAWSSLVLGDGRVRFDVVRKHLHWFGRTTGDYQAVSGCPVFFFELPEGYFYGMPAIDDRGVKAAGHHGGEAVGDPAQLDRTIDPQEREEVVRFVGKHLPGVTNAATGHAVCMYTRTADEHFVVDRHPDCEHVVFAAGLSGHGFKFAGVLGQALADLALEGKTDLPIEFLRLDRPALKTE